MSNINNTQSQKLTLSERILKRKRINYLNKESLFIRFLKFASILPFVYSGFFWGLIAAINISSLEVGVVKAYFVYASIALYVLAFIFMFFRKYIVSFIISITGTFMYLYVFNNIIKQAYKLDKLDLASKLELRHYPIVFINIFILIIVGIKLYNYIDKKAKEKNDKINAPAKSILED